MRTVRFYSANEEYGCFSNFSLHPTVIDDVVYPTTEHYFQSQKFTDEAVRRRVRAARTPVGAARLGRDCAHRLRKGWESMKDEVMLRAVRAKVDQHDVRELLLSTGDALIVDVWPV